MRHPRLPGWLPLALVLATVPPGGCLTIDAKQPPTSQPPTEGSLDRPSDGRLTLTQLEELVQGFADRYFAMVSTACDALARRTSDPDKRLLIDQFQTRTITAVYDIASNEDPFTKLLDLTVVVTLTSSLMIDEGKATELFGEDAPILIRPLRRAREEILEVGARALTAEQLETMDRLIVDWRRKNPDVETVSFVRFDDFAASRGKSVVADVRSGTGLLAPVDDARKSVDEAILFGERVFYMSKRAPLLISMQSGSILSQVAALPEIRESLAIGGRLAENVDRLTTVAEALPGILSEEREKLVDSVDRTSDSLRETLGEYQRAIDRTDQLVGHVTELSQSARALIGGVDSAAGTLRGTIEAAEGLAEQFAPPPGAEPATPVDPQIYLRMLDDLRGSLVEVNKALESTKELVGGAAWQKPLAAVSAESEKSVRQLSAELRSVVDRAALWALGIVGAAFVLRVLFHVIAAKRGPAHSRPAT